jgi:aminoglycoside 3-N-acetyltransferase
VKDETMATTVTAAGVTGALRDLGVGEENSVFLHSSLKSLGYVQGGADAVIDGFLDAVGPGGTVVVPTFKLTEREGPFGSWYDHENTASTVGLITETLRKRPGARRSFHPIHSCAALGRLAREVTEPHGAAWGRISPWCDASFAWNSPLDLLARWNAWYVLLGVSFRVQTVVHYLETIVVDASLRMSPPAERARRRQAVRRWGQPGVWPSIDRVPLGEALRDHGTYAEVRIGEATVYGARLQRILGRALELVLGDPERCFNAAFREWLGEPPSPAATLAEYTSPAGVPPEPDDRASAKIAKSCGVLPA